MHTISQKRLKNIVGRFNKARIMVIGDIMLDEYIWGKVTRISPEAPVPIVNVHRETSMPGGAANVARNISSLGANASSLGVVGNDIYGKYLVKLLKEENVDIKGIVKSSRGKTIIKTRIIAHSQQVVRIDRENDVLNNNNSFSKLTNYIKKNIKDVDGVIIEDYGKGLITQKLVYFLIDICNENNKPLIVDPKKGHFMDYSGATTLTPNLEEALAVAGREYDGEYNPEVIDEIGDIILDKWGLKSILITLGEHGMCLFEKGKHPFKIPTMAKEIFDVSGAGDTVVGVFITALASGASMKEASVLSNMAAGIVVGKVGTALVTRKELNKIISLNGK